MDYKTLALGCNFRLFNDTTQQREVQKESTPSGKLVSHLKNNRFSDTYSTSPSQIHQAPTSHSLPNRKQTPNKASGLVINPNRGHLSSSHSWHLSTVGLCTLHGLCQGPRGKNIKCLAMYGYLVILLHMIPKFVHPTTYEVGFIYHSISQNMEKLKFQVYNSRKRQNIEVD